MSVSLVVRRSVARRSVSSRRIAGQVSHLLPWRRTSNPRVPRLRANSMSVSRSPTIALPARSTSRARTQSSTSLVFGLRQSQPSSLRCGQTNTASNSMSWELNASSMNWCGMSKLVWGKLALPSPSWLVTMASWKPARCAWRRAENTPGMKRIFSMESTCSSGGSSMRVPSRSTNSTRVLLMPGSGSIGRSVRGCPRKCAANSAKHCACRG